MNELVNVGPLGNSLAQESTSKSLFPILLAHCRENFFAFVRRFSLTIVNLMVYLALIQTVYLQKFQRFNLHFVYMASL